MRNKPHWPVTSPSARRWFAAKRARDGIAAAQLAICTVTPGSGVGAGLRFAVALISIDDALHQRVAYDIA